MRKIWDYGTSTPIQRIGIIVLSLGLVSLLAWVIKEDLSFEDIFDSYHLPRHRDSFFFHLYFYLIPLGFLMSWGYQVLLKLKEWVLNGVSERIEPKIEAKKRQSNIPTKKNLHFKNNLAAFKYASENYVACMLPGQMTLGIIQEVFQLKDGSYSFLVQLADKNKTTLTSGFNEKYATQIGKGNLVYWGFVEKVDQPKDYFQISAIGHILAILHPEFNPNDGKWSIKSNLTK